MHKVTRFEGTRSAHLFDIFVRLGRGLEVGDTMLEAESLSLLPGDLASIDKINLVSADQHGDSVQSLHTKNLVPAEVRGGELV